jgi:hypothetical protein
LDCCVEFKRSLRRNSRARKEPRFRPCKVQLFEYRQAAILNVADLGPRDQRILSKLGEKLLLGYEEPAAVIAEIDNSIHDIAGHAVLKRKRLMETLQDTVAASRMPKPAHEHMVTV